MAKPPSGAVGYPCTQGNQFASNQWIKRWKRKISNQTISEEARKKLDSNAELWRAESEYIKLEDKETRILQFNPEKIEQVKGQYGFKISYSVIDPNYADRGPKKFDAGKIMSKKIDALLLQGKTLLKVTRKGNGRDTEYDVVAAD